MDTGKFSDKAQNFAKSLVEALNDNTVDTLVGGFTEASRADLFKGGIAVGAAHAYEQIMPRALEISYLLREVYKKVDELTGKYDDMQTLADLSAIRGMIAGYMLKESDHAIRVAKLQISRDTGVPARYIDESVLITDIPSIELAAIGRKAAAQDVRKFAIFAVSGSRSTKDGKTPTMDELVELVKTGQVSANTDVHKTEFETLLPSYGGVFVRRAREAYKNVQRQVDAYRDAHNSDAEMVAADIIKRVSKPD